MKDVIRIGYLLFVTALFAPDGARAQQGGFMWPVSVAVGPAMIGTVPGLVGLVVSENARHRISVFDRNGNLITRFGARGSNGSVGGLGGNDGEFNNPLGIAVDSQGLVFVADTGNARVQKLDPRSGNVVAKWGSPGSGPGQFRKPRAIAVDAEGNVSVLDSQTGMIQKFSSDGARHLGLWGGLGTGDAQFSPAGGGPADLAIDAMGFAYVSDPVNHRIKKWQIVSDAATGMIQSATFVGWSGRCTSGTSCDASLERSNGFTCTAMTCASTSLPGSGIGQFLGPQGLALDRGILSVTDTGNHRVQQFDTSNGQFVRAWGTRGSTLNSFINPADVAASGNDHYVADTSNQRVLRFRDVTLSPMVGEVIGGEIALSATPGYPPQSLDPLVDANPLFVMAGGTATTTVRVTSVNAFAGPVTLATTGCCEDYLSRMPLPAAVTTTFVSPTVQVPADNFGETVLTIAAPGTALPRKVLIPLAAGNPALGVSDMTGIVADIVSIPPNRGTRPCVAPVVFGGGEATLPEVLPLSAMTTGLYRLKSSAPTRTSFVVGVASVLNQRRYPFRMTIGVAKATSTLLPGQALVVLNNTSGQDKEIGTILATNCAAAPQPAVVAPNQSATLLISTADTTTLVLNEKYCQKEFIGLCFQYAFRSRAMFDDGAFWSFFGGRQLTINWAQ
jgi:hypothetical protein